MLPKVFLVTSLFALLIGRALPLGDLVTSFYFPFLVLLAKVKNEREWTPMGSGTIFSDKKALFVLENLYGPTQDIEEAVKEFKLPDFVIFSGAKKLIYDGISRRDTRSHIIESVHISSYDLFTDTKATTFFKQHKDLIKNPDSAAFAKQRRNEVQELLFNIGLFTLNYTTPFRFSYNVLPMRRMDSEMIHYHEAWIDKLEQFPDSEDPCYVPGWSGWGNKRLKYHEVTYVPQRSCMDFLCGYNRTWCLTNVIERVHCFRSNYAGDSCYMDQGAPLYCPSYPYRNKVFAVLTKAFSCGRDGVPAFYTSMRAIAANFYEHLFNYDLDPSVKIYNHEQWPHVPVHGAQVPP